MTNNPGGYMGRILSVDLSTGMMVDESPPTGLLRSFIGGYGLGVRLIYPQMAAGTDPLGPENILGVAAGPLTGTPAILGPGHDVRRVRRRLLHGPVRETGISPTGRGPG